MIAPPAQPRVGRARLGFVALSVLSLLPGALWERCFRHSHEQKLQLLGLLLVGVWAALSYAVSSDQRRVLTQTFFGFFVCLAALMALFPHLLQAEPSFYYYYRGQLRWRGWTIDPNNSAVTLGVALVLALRLREELPPRFSRLLLVVTALFILQLLRSFSRIGLLVALVGLLFWLAPRWQALALNRKRGLCLVALLGLLALPHLGSRLQASNWLVLRRAASFSNIMDLSWANRLYVLPGAFQATLAHPWSGWGWGKVLPVHQAIYSPTYLKNNTALLLNDYAHLAASYGLPLLAACILLIFWALLHGHGAGCAKITVACLATAMFFQGVVRIPLTFIPLCVSLGLLLGESPPWKGALWKALSVPVLPLVCLVLFLTAWLIGPLSLTNKLIHYSPDMLVIEPKGILPPLTLAYVTTQRLEAHGREARAIACLGVRSVVVHPEALEAVERTYGTNVWLVTESPGLRHISPKEFGAADGLQRGVRVARGAFDESGRAPTTPQPDKPFSLRTVVLALYACAVLVVMAQCLAGVPPPAALGVAGTAATVAFLLSLHTPSDWMTENSEVAAWAKQMHQAIIPDDVYRRYVLEPQIAPGFSLRHRRELWYTFYQTCTADNPMEMAQRLKEAIDVQILIRPDPSPPVASFNEIWVTRTCNLAERWYILIAALRTLNVPARMWEGKPEIWVEGKWLRTSL